MTFCDVPTWHQNNETITKSKQKANLILLDKSYFKMTKIKKNLQHKFFQPIKCFTFFSNLPFQMPSDFCPESPQVLTQGQGLCAEVHDFVLALYSPAVEASTPAVVAQRLSGLTSSYRNNRSQWNVGQKVKVKDCVWQLTILIQHITLPLISLVWGFITSNSIWA